MDRLYAIHIKPVELNGKMAFSVEQVATKDKEVQIIDNVPDLEVLIGNLANYYYKEYSHAHNS